MCAKRSEKQLFNLPKHVHCTICGLPIPVNKQFCSNKCREEYLRRIKRKRQMDYLYLALIVAFSLMILISFLVR